ncbi:hypothetical protein CL653_01030 [bacterium]|nr:hypothetical protein [bacterium]|tara:strand:+ start:446 stop:985 length:540 start_codon:yes stop_codon:yes gene_type:complete
MQLQKTKKILIVATLFCFTSVFVFVFSSLLIRKEADELMKVTQAVSNEMMTHTYEENLATILHSIEPDKNELESYLIMGDEGAIKLLTQLEEFAEQVGVTLHTDKLDTVTLENSYFSDLHIAVTFEGSLSATQTMINILENIPYSGQISMVTVVKTSDPVTKLPVTNVQAELTFSIVEI